VVNQPYMGRPFLEVPLFGGGPRSGRSRLPVTWQGPDPQTVGGSGSE